MVNTPKLWAIELSTKARQLISECQRAQGPDYTTARASALMREALVIGLTELAKRQNLQGLELTAEAGAEGTLAWPVGAGM